MDRPPSHSQSLLPNSTALVLEKIQRDDEGFILEVSSQSNAHCPDCGTRSRSFHSFYGRHLQDLPWQGLPVRLRVKARRFRCRNSSCARKIFVERLPDIARSYARQTDRLREIIRCAGFVAGGLPASRLLKRLAILVSDDTVLRLVKLRPSWNAGKAVRYLGVDDWAWRKGQQYGTILVDLERHCVVDLLPERSAESLANWLANNPAVSVISRDRCGLYAEGATAGAPDAQQVADRFHLIVNLSAAIERALEERSRLLQLPAPEAPREADIGIAGNSAKPTQQQILQKQRRERRLELYQEVVKLHNEGYSQVAISRTLKIQRKTVRRWLRSGQFPERKPPARKPAKVHEFDDYLRQRWKEGCHNATRLFEEIRKQGYRGRRGMVAHFVSGWRASNSPATPNRPRRLTPRGIAILTTRAPDQLTEEQAALFNQLSSSCPDLPWMRTLALEFRAVLKSKDSNQLNDWIQTAKLSGIGHIVRFAFGLQKDMTAVSAAVESAWSNGQVEGQINRLKTIKRQMYGRAGLPLLKARILPYQAFAVNQRAP
jgi:transposase